MAEKNNAAQPAATTKKRRLFVSALACFMTVAMSVSALFGIAGCDKNNEAGPPDFSTQEPPSDKVVEDDNPTTNGDKPIVSTPSAVEGEIFENKYAATTAVGYSAKVLGTVDRKKSVAYLPGTTTERVNEGATFGNVEYPAYGYTLNSVVGAGDDKTQARQNLIEESDYFCAYGTRNNSGNGNNGDGTYTWMDENGYLYSGTTSAPVHAKNADGSDRQLYKHSSAAGMYYGGFNNTDDLLDSEPGIVKEVTIRPRGYSSYSVTGVYAPAGEIIKIEISEKDMNATGGITIHIGQALYNGQSNNIWAAKGQMQRFPNVLNTMNVNKDTATLKDGVYTAYVGSFVGGPLYIRNTLASFTAKISGGVAYSHFILGYTTEEEFEKNSKSTAPYFDLEVWNYGVLHSGTKYQAMNFSYDDLYKAAILWEKISSVTTTGSSQGIVFLYEPFVAAGAAVAFPGRSSVNCPTGWMSSSLNYNALVSSGAWGNLHEYHHNFQGYGVGNGGEVTNNGMTLVSYALFTKISSKRGIGSYGAQGLGGWNSYTSATWALNDILSISRGGQPSNGNQGLALYATLLHNFGANNYIQAKVKGGGQSYQAYANAWEATTHNNMSYYFNDVLKGGITSTAPSEYPMFVPVSSVYQTGRSYMYDGQKKYFNTMQPYVIPYGADFNIDLSKYTAPDNQYKSGSIVIPDNFDYRIKSVTQPKHGSIEIVDNYNFKFKPDNNKLSGQILVTLEITEKKNRFKVDDVDLILEFEQSHETNKMTLERTTYTYTAQNMYTDAKTAYENNFANYTSVVEKADHSNPVQNSNTDIWFYPDTEQNRKDHPDSPESHFVHPNTIEVIDGKLYFEDEGKYRIYLRGRTNCALFIEYTDAKGKEQKASAQVTNGSGSGFYTNDPKTYIDVELSEHSWVNIKEVLIVQTSPVSYIGLGYGIWTKPMFTMVEKYYDANNKEVSSPDAPGYSYTKTHYYDYQGKEVTEEVANKAELIAPKGATYINAYRSSYEFPDNTAFEADYFYKRQYTYSYNDNVWVNKDASQSVTSENYKPWSATDHKLENLVDGDRNTYIHTNFKPTDLAPFEFIVDLGEEKTVNRMSIYSQSRSDLQIAKSFTLYGSKDGVNFYEVVKVDDAKNVGATVTVDFDEATFRYYKMSVNRSSNKYIIISEIELWKIFEINGGKAFTPDDSVFTYGGNWRTEQTPSTFGHVFVGEKNAQMAFKFKGTRLGLLSSEAFGKNFEVIIDGEKVNSITLKAITDGYGFSYISSELEDKEHTVLIKCTGQANIDSVVIYQ